MQSHCEEKSGYADVRGNSQIIGIIFSDLRLEILHMVYCKYLQVSEQVIPKFNISKNHKYITSVIEVTNFCLKRLCNICYKRSHLWKQDNCIWVGGGVSRFLSVGQKNVKGEIRIIRFSFLCVFVELSLVRWNNKRSCARAIPGPRDPQCAIRIASFVRHLLHSCVGHTSSYAVWVPLTNRQEKNNDRKE